jgi:hypothetical protein
VAGDTLLIVLQLATLRGGSTHTWIPRAGVSGKPALRLRATGQGCKWSFIPSDECVAGRSAHRWRDGVAAGIHADGHRRHRYVGDGLPCHGSVPNIPAVFSGGVRR